MPLLRLPSTIVLFLDCPHCRLRCISVFIAAALTLPFLHQVFLVADHCVHHHIEYFGQKWVALSDASLSEEGLSGVPSRPCHHLQPLAIPAEEAEGPGPHTISLHDVLAPGPVQGTVCLVQVQEDNTEHRLPQVRNLMEQIDLEGGGPRTATCPEPVEGVVLGDGGGDAAIALLFSCLVILFYLLFPYLLSAKVFKVHLRMIS